MKGLETELETTSVEVPHAPVIARPDKAKLDCQARYGARVRGLVFDLFNPHSAHLLSHKRLWLGTQL